MKTRIIVALSLLPLLLLVVLACPAWATALLVAAMAVVAVYELLHTAGFAPNLRIVVYSMVMAAATVLRTLFVIPQFYATLVIFLYFVLLALELLLYGTLDVYFSAKCGSSFKEKLTLCMLFPVFHAAYGWGSVRGIFKLCTKEYRDNSYSAPKI